MRSEADIRAELVSQGREWIGTPFTPYARRKGAAADCIFHEAIGRHVGVYNGNHKGYSLWPSDGHLVRYADAELVVTYKAEPGRRAPLHLPPELLLPGDLMLIAYANPDEGQHFGMIADHPAVSGVKTFIHAMRRTDGNGGRVVEQPFSNSPRMMRGVVRLYRFPGVRPADG